MSKHQIKCEQCDEPSKYTCPKCSSKSCSVKCVKNHKEIKKCDGQRSDCPQFVRISGYSAFNNDVSLDDQYFLELINSNVRKRQSSASLDTPSLKKLSLINPLTYTDNENSKTFTDKNRNKFSIIDSLPFAQRLLVQNAHKKRIWMNVNSTEDCAESRYQKFADTIFWTVKLIFLNHLQNDKVNSTDNIVSNVPIYSCQSENIPEYVKFEEGEIDESKDNISNLIKNKQNNIEIQKVNENNCFVIDETPKVNFNQEIEKQEYIVHNIPETLTVNTLIRQFVKPKNFGPLISKSDLDMDKMQKFINRNLIENGIIVYMKVSCTDDNKYYVIDTNRSLLDNLRNRYIGGHPELIVTMSNEFDEFKKLTVEEALHLQDERRNELRLYNVKDNKFNKSNHRNFDNKYNQSQQKFNNVNVNHNHQNQGFDNNFKYDNYYKNGKNYGINNTFQKNNFYQNNIHNFKGKYKKRNSNRLSDLDEVERYLEDPFLGQTQDISSCKK